MPTIDQGIATLVSKKRKYGGEAHINQIFVSEEIRRQQIENKADDHGKKKTRVSLETYSPDCYSDFNAFVEEGMEECGYNPIIFLYLVMLLWRLAKEQRIATRLADGTAGEISGLKAALDVLFEVHQKKAAMPYEDQLRAGKETKKKRRKKPKKEVVTGV
jgi:hypothetical protein